MDILEEEIKKADDKNGFVNGVDSRRLVSFIERIERLEEEKKSVQDDIRDVFAQAKSEGWSVKAIREVLKLRKLDSADRDEQDFLVNEYRKMAGI
jgi:uncharacterized protein (UPF0335 family)